MVVGQICLCNLHALLSGLAVIVFKSQAELGEREILAAVCGRCVAEEAVSI